MFDIHPALRLPLSVPFEGDNDSGSPIGKCFPQEVQQAWWRLIVVDDEGVEVTEAVAKIVEMTGALGHWTEQIPR